MVEKILKSHLIPVENFIYGFADLTGLLDKKFGDFIYGISIGRRLEREIINKVIEAPTKEYYSHYRQINEELEQLTNDISKDLNANGMESLNIKPTVYL